ncbi:MAG TPA: hypothetical protein VLG50_05055 [Candidatus Saccharimonadales bacterium]|nr:hypothetical protein [Candidatus Saccharimonadales bacterium]
MKRFIEHNQPRHVVNQDELYNILWHADTSTIRQLCQMNKTAHALCQKDQWKSKFDNDSLPSFNGKYTLYNYLYMSHLQEEAEDLFLVMSENDYMYLTYIYPDKTVVYKNIHFTPKYVIENGCIKKTYHEFLVSLMYALHKHADIYDRDTDRVSYIKSVLLKEPKCKKKAQDRLKLYDKMELERLGF